MPITTFTIELSPTPVKILDELRGRRMVVFTNESGNPLHVAGPNLDTDDGMKVTSGTQLIVHQHFAEDYTPSHEWWGRTDGGTSAIIVTYATQDSTD